MKRPWMKWYPSDWRADPRLRMCSLAARGLWADLISYMHEGKPYGHLTIDSMSPDTPQIASLVARPLPEVRKALAELEDMKVSGRTDDGVLYSRRMIRDNERSEEGRKQIGKRWGDRGPNRSPDREPTAAPITLDTRDQKEADAGDAREALVSPEAISLANEVATIAGHPDPESWPPGWCGAPMRVQAWLNQGWHREIILVAVREVTAKRAAKAQGPPNTVQFFENAIAETIARQASPLPVAEVRSSPKVLHVQANQRHPAGEFGASKDRFRAAHRELKARIAELGDEGNGDDGGGPAPEFLPAARRS